MHEKRPWLSGPVLSASLLRPLPYSLSTKMPSYDMPGRVLFLCFVLGLSAVPIVSGPVVFLSDDPLGLGPGPSDPSEMRPRRLCVDRGPRTPSLRGVAHPVSSLGH